MGVQWSIVVSVAHLVCSCSRSCGRLLLKPSLGVEIRALVNASQTVLFSAQIVYWSVLPFYFWKKKLLPILSFQLSGCQHGISPRKPHSGMLWAAASCTSFILDEFLLLRLKPSAQQFCCCTFRCLSVAVPLARMYCVVKMQNKGRAGH